MTPNEYIVFWGWGEPGAFEGPVQAREDRRGLVHATLTCDPQGAGKYMADFVYNIGGTEWANVQTQYYETTPAESSYINENGSSPGSGSMTPPAPTSRRRANNPPGPTHTYTDMATEASAGVRALRDQRPGRTPTSSSPSRRTSATRTALTPGYCAFHDYT